MSDVMSKKDRLWEVASELTGKQERFCNDDQLKVHCNNPIQMKANQIVNNLTCLGDIVAHMYENKKLNQKEFDDIKHLDSTPIRANEKLLNIIANKPSDVYESFLALLKTTNQSHLYQILVSNDNCTELEQSVHQEAIRRNFVWCSEKLDTENELVPLLYQKNVISIREKEQIDSTPDLFRKNELLLSLVAKKSPKSFEKFISALRDTNQQHVVSKLNELKGSSAEEQRNIGLTANHKMVSKKVPPKVPSKPKLKSHSKDIYSPQHSRGKAAETIQHNIRKKNYIRKTNITKVQTSLLLLERQIQKESYIKVASILQALATSGGSIKMSVPNVLQVTLSMKFLLEEIEHDKTEAAKFSAEVLTKNTQRFDLNFMKEPAEKAMETSLNKISKFQERVKLSEKRDRFTKSTDMNNMKEMLESEEKENGSVRSIINKFEKIVRLSEKREMVTKPNERPMNKMEERLESKEKEKYTSMVNVSKLRSTSKIDTNETENYTLKKVALENRVTHEKIDDDSLPVTEDVVMKLENNQNFCNNKDSHCASLDTRVKESNAEGGKETVEECRMLNLTEKEPVAAVRNTEDDIYENIQDYYMSKQIDTTQQEHSETIKLHRNVSENQQDLDGPDSVSKLTRRSMSETFTSRVSSVKTKEHLAVTNNYQFLMENMNSTRLVDLLLSKHCLSERQHRLINAAEENFYRNDEILQWMKGIKFEQWHVWKTVLECLRETGQNAIADIIERGGVAVKSKVTSKVEILSRWMPSSESKPKPFALQQHTEMLVVEKINQKTKLPLSLKPGCGQRTSHFFTSVPDIAPYSRCDSDGIILWFLCYSRGTLVQLQEMHEAGILLNQINTLFRELSSQNAILIPQNLIIFTDDCQKQTEIGENLFPKRTRMVTFRNTKTRINGLTTLEDEIYVAHQSSPVIEIYNKNNLRLMRDFVVENLKDPNDIVSCSTTRNLYILEHYRKWFILVIDTQGIISNKIPIGNNSCRISVTKESKIILSNTSKNKIVEMSTKGEILREITAEKPQNAIYLENDNFLVGCGDEGRLCIITSAGRVLFSANQPYKDLQRARINPVSMGVDETGSIYVLDVELRRIVNLTPTLEYLREISWKNEPRIPERMCVDLNGQLYVAEVEHGKNVSWIHAVDVGRSRNSIILSDKYGTI